MRREVLRAEKISKTYLAPTPIHVLKGASLELFASEAVAIRGKSGEGKSTLLHILGTLERPSSGKLTLCGQKVEEPTAPLRRRHIGFIFQAFHLLEECSVLENVLMPMRIARQNAGIDSTARKKALELLCAVGLKERLTHPVKLLSGGEKQRTAIARALIGDPDLLLADEPSGNLDENTSLEIHRLLLDACKERGKALLVVTHDDTLAALCDRQLLLKDGVLVS